MTFQNGKRMVHPRRIHYEQGVLNQSFLLPTTKYWAGNHLLRIATLNQDILNGAYLHLTMRFMDNNNI